MKNWITEPLTTNTFKVDAKEYMYQDGKKLRRLRRMNRSSFSSGMNGKSITNRNTFVPVLKLGSFRYDK